MEPEVSELLEEFMKLLWSADRRCSGSFTLLTATTALLIQINVLLQVRLATIPCSLQGRRR